MLECWCLKTELKKMSHQIELVTFYDLCQHMLDIKTDLHPAELQGIAFGFICLNDMHQAERLWAKFLLEEFAEILDDPSHVPFLEMMGRIFRGCEAEIFGSDYSITLCLPADDTPMELRTEALSAWCKGFLYGLGVAGKPECLETPDIQDALLDLSSMLNLAYDEEDEEDNERAYVELVEYLKLVPLMILQEQASEQREETVH